MKASPKGWPRISSSLYYDQPAAAIDWLCTAFGFEVRLKVEGDGGMIVHSELTYGDGVIMVSGNAANSAHPDWKWLQSPRDAGGANTQNLFMYVDDVEAHCANARAHGAVITDEPSTHDYGEDYWTDRSYGAVDLGGHHWWFAQRMRDPK